jgi:hypothetical protein
MGDVQPLQMTGHGGTGAAQDSKAGRDTLTQPTSQGARSARNVETVGKDEFGGIFFYFSLFLINIREMNLGKTFF